MESLEDIAKHLEADSFVVARDPSDLVVRAYYKDLDGTQELTYTIKQTDEGFDVVNSHGDKLTLDSVDAVIYYIDI